MRLKSSREGCEASLSSMVESINQAIINESVLEFSVVNIAADSDVSVGSRQFTARKKTKRRRPALQEKIFPTRLTHFSSSEYINSSTVDAPFFDDDVVSFALLIIIIIVIPFPR